MFDSFADLEMQRRHFLKQAGALALMAGGVSTLPGCAGDPSWVGGEVDENLLNQVKLAHPQAKQVAWQEAELGMFYHFDIPIFKPGWKWRSFKNMPSPKDFNPKHLDTDQWLEAAVAMGATYAVLVAKHCSGFLTWQSDLYPYGVKQAAWKNGKGDLVEDFIRSCHKYGIKPGIYASVTANCFWEVDNPGRVNRGKGTDKQKQERYVQTQEKMLEELWGRYGKLFYIWFDGGSLSPEEGGPDLVPIYQRLQSGANVFQGPNATTRWIGNERGVASYPCWSTVNKRNESGSGSATGKIWQPGECDVPLRKRAWFWKKNQEHLIHSLDELMDIYYRSVGHNCNLLLNANPNTDGQIPKADMKRYEEFGAELKRRFEQPLKKAHGRGRSVELVFDRAKNVNHVWIMEDIRYGQRVRGYEIQALRDDGRWVKIGGGSAVGHKRIEAFKDVKTRALRLRIDQSVGTPVIREFAAFDVS